MVSDGVGREENTYIYIYQNLPSEDAPKVRTGVST